ncbi:MAG: OmpA family protein [Balneolales bacterium]
MKTKIDLKTSTHLSRSLYNLMAFFCISAVILTTIQAPAYAQEAEYERPAWKFGLTGAGNFNFYQGTTQDLAPGAFAPQAFNHGNGLGLYVGPMIEYRRPNSVLGFMLQAGYDSRRGTWDQVMTPCNCPADLSTELSYISVEPSLTVAPFKSNFYLFAGPRLAFGLNKSFEYEQGANPDFPNSSQPVNKSGDFSNMDKTQLSLQLGAGLDIPISSSSKKTQFMLSPFVSFQPYFGQTPRSIETWNITTIRTGVSIKFGRGKRIEATAPVAIAPAAPVNFTVNSPVNAPVNVSFIESFPLRNYVFFDVESTSIPDRYIKLNKVQAENFSEDQLGRFNQITASGRSARQMTVYYNILNILGDRMVTNPGSTITLVGLSEQNMREARQRAESVKSYLVTTFGVNRSRITTDGVVKSSVSSNQNKINSDSELLRQESNRVSIESNTIELLKEYQTGPDAPLGSIAISEHAPLDSYVTINVAGAANAFKSWKLEVSDENGKMKTFGPYYRDNVRLSGKSIMGSRTRGDYTFTMVGETQNGRTVRENERAEVILWVTPVVEHGKRYSVLYEFDNSTVTAAYEKYLLDVVSPAIPEGSTIRIQGYSDTIGDRAYNQQLSESRAANVKAILQNGLTQAGRTDVKFEVKSHGGVIPQSQFGNSLPEERFYNRTVLIDIMPIK